jgi:hypothetical protein
MLQPDQYVAYKFDLTVPILLLAAGLAWKFPSLAIYLHILLWIVAVVLGGTFLLALLYPRSIAYEQFANKWQIASQILATFVFLGIPVAFGWHYLTGTMAILLSGYLSARYVYKQH